MSEAIKVEGRQCSNNGSHWMACASLDCRHLSQRFISPAPAKVVANTLGECALHCGYAGATQHAPLCPAAANPETTKVPKCGWSGANHTGAVLLRVARTGEVVTVCDGCWLSNEAVIADNVGGGIAPYTGPERLEKPKMAGDSWWLDSAEDVR